MEYENFIDNLIDEILLDGTREYLVSLSSTPEGEITDQNWKETFLLYHSLSEIDKIRFEKLLKLTTITAISSVLGIIDGSINLKDQEHSFELLYNGKIISGDLQDTFLEKIENIEN